jgi:hypothetical protein
MVPSMDRNIAINIFGKAALWLSYKILTFSSKENVLIYRNVEKLQLKIQKKK